MSAFDVMAKHLDHDLDNRADGTVRCRTCSYTLLPTTRSQPIYSQAPGCGVCRAGFKGENEAGQVIACLTCRPHLIPMFNRRQAVEQERAQILADREANR